MSARRAVWGSHGYEVVEVMVYTVDPLLPENPFHRICNSCKNWGGRPEAKRECTVDILRPLLLEPQEWVVDLVHTHEVVACLNIQLNKQACP